jgi:hypothetical protein
MAKVAFLYVGGLHQVFHTAAVAAEMSKQPDADVHCLYANKENRDLFEEIAKAFGHGRITYRQLKFHRIWRPFIKAFNVPHAHKMLRLFANRHMLSEFEAIVTPERTSAVLRNWVAPRTRLIHFKHGAGDGQKGFEERLKSFDMVVVAGEKDRQRLYEENLVKQGACVVAGSIKLASTNRLNRPVSRLFDNDRPVVLYNPHFNEKLSSWPTWGKAIVESFAQQDTFNLIVAPHIRMFERATASQRKAFTDLAVPGKIAVDAGSIASCDMTYIEAADIYLGDVSSQTYEFIAKPRPCIFLNAHGVDWENDKNYAFWHFGYVVKTVENALPALKSAQKLHDAVYKDRQAAMTVPALGEDWQNAPARAARIISDQILIVSAETQRARQFSFNHGREASL